MYNINNVIVLLMIKHCCGPMPMLAWHTVFQLSTLKLFSVLVVVLILFWGPHLFESGALSKIMTFINEDKIEKAMKYCSHFKLKTL